MTSKTDTAKQLVAIATDEARLTMERLEAYLQADTLRKELKVGWEKLGTTKPAMMLLTERLTKLVDLAQAVEDKYGPVDWEQSTPLKAMTPDELLKSKGAVTAKAFFSEVPGHDDFELTTPPLPEGWTEVTETASEPETDKPEPEATEAPPALTAAERGAIGVMARDLLQTDASYEDIALAIRAKYPHAKTTARSLASVAADMRRDGIPTPSRRKGGK